MKTTLVRNRGGFTLIELLVVVAIIALLISILLPTLSRAKEQAKTAQCIANERSTIQATTMYFHDYNDSFPFQAKDGGVCSWSYGGKTNHDYWEAEPWCHHPVQDRPLNCYLLGSTPDPDIVDASDNIVRRTEIPILKCPSDRHSYQRDWDNFEEQGDCISAYDDIGTSYHFNLAAFLRGGKSPDDNMDVLKNGLSPSQMTTWLWGNQNGWSIMVRDAIRDALLKHSSTYVMFWEDPMDWALGAMIQVPGNHRMFSRHSICFLDGHATNTYVDTRVQCGPGWHSLNPEWIPPEPPDQPWGKYYYHNIWYRNCDPYSSGN
ncbi:MAG: prepilin-type N-terminal cleavage/methylation domain-containing protein [Phycisphaerae bacterium]|nr:prepilin-type N-terminal cleavage/methylation domain-containing protein [Phycisphaerae bacterium]